MARNRITLAAAPEVDVVLSDPDLETGDRVYHLVPMTRDVKAKLREIIDEGQALLKPYGEDEVLTREDEERLLRLRCDQLNLVLTGGADAPAAGDLLYAGYEALRVTDAQIEKLHDSVMSATADPS